MNIALWVLQGLLAAMFLMAGSTKLSKPETAKKQGIADPNLVKLIGTSEVLGALGLILPAATRILPWLTPLAAAGIAVIMVLATRFHLQRKETKAVPVTLALLAFAVAVVLGRLFFSPVA